MLQEIKDYVLTNAHGVILWASTVMDEMLKLAGSPTFSFELLREEALKMPKSLTNLYIAIVEDRERQLSHKKQTLARKAMMWVYRATLKRPISLQELFDALAIPEDVSQISTDPSVQDPFADTRFLYRPRWDCSEWFQFRQSLLELCGPLLDIAPPQDSDLGSAEDIGPFHIVQFLHGTVREFLFTSPNAGFLAFQAGESEALVQKDLERYAQVTLSRPPPPTSPDWPLNIFKIKSYLNNKYLLSFSLDCLQDSSRLIPPHYRHLIETTLHPPFESQTSASLNETFGNETLLYHQFPGVNPHQAVLVGRYFRQSCRLGQFVAAQNLLSILTSAVGWWDEFADIVLNGALLAAMDADCAEALPALTEDGRHRGLHLCPWRAEEDLMCSDFAPTLWEASRTGNVKATMWLFDRSFTGASVHLRGAWLRRVEGVSARAVLAYGGGVDAREGDE